VNESTKKYEAIVIGTSSGGLDALSIILPGIPKDLSASILIVQHVAPESQLTWTLNYLQQRCAIPIVEAELGMDVFPPKVIFAPPGYHLLVERDHTLSLDVGEKRNHSRPSIDVLFETAADAFKEKLIGIVLTGANEDGAQGLLQIRQSGGFGIVQDPESASAQMMPAAAIRIAGADHVTTLDQIAPKIAELCNLTSRG
jgi:two-component system chemotaxis response regulator CheB